jgi:hypothetical protein
MQYYKTSAFTGDGIDKLMDDTIKEVYDKKLKAEFDAAKLG